MTVEHKYIYYWWALNGCLLPLAFFSKVSNISLTLPQSQGLYLALHSQKQRLRLKVIFNTGTLF